MLREKRTPRTYPYITPILKSSLPFLFDNKKFLAAVFKWASNEAVTHVALFRIETYILQGAANIASVFNKPGMSASFSYSFALGKCFGMKDKAIEVYRKDDSGTRLRPMLGSNVPDEDRIMFKTHNGLVAAFMGVGLASSTERLERHLTESLVSVGTSGKWEYFPDLAAFFEFHLGGSIVKMICGSLLFEECPNFLDDLWQYDKIALDILKGVPRFWNSNAFTLRQQLINHLKQFHTRAKEESARCDCHSHGFAPDSDFDPFWGSRLVRERIEMLEATKGQDEDSIASANLGLIWATVTNIIPSTTTIAHHVFRDKNLLSEIRIIASTSIRSNNPTCFDFRSLEKSPLLMSIYAESVRFGIQINVPRVSPYADVVVGNYFIPRNKLILINTWHAHTDESIWNTQNGKHPLENYWARRFVVDPKDNTSGPTRNSWLGKKSDLNVKGSDGTYFSLDGLDGAWIPYGGGGNMCPGRILAKRIMLLMTAMLTTDFEIEILADEQSQEYVSDRFGFGARKPVKEIPFRIRRRTVHLEIL
ncbi:cytochrome P450 [Tricladium varicosporioides]|nr:cytochrome P450 [Hymenoscyphus varicosporioides]